MPPRPHRLRAFAASQSAMAAIEFALVVPILFTIMFGGLQVVAYINAARRVSLLTQSMSQMLSQVVPPANASIATVNATDLHFSYDSALVLFPYLMKDAKQQNIQWWQNIRINFSSIAFTKLLPICSDPTDQSLCYLANVVWTTTGLNASNFRPCIVPQLPADNTAAPTPATLPRSVYGPASIIVVDVVYTFRPTFGASFVPPIKIVRSAYVQPRYASLINFDTTNNDGIASKCLGY